MPRARWNKAGIVIARQSFDVDTAAPINILFSSDAATRNVFLAGTVPIGGAVTTGPYSNHYCRSTVTFGKTIDPPPDVIVGIKLTTDSMLYLPMAAIGGAGLWEPEIFGATGTTQLDLYSRITPSANFHDFAFIILENSIG